MRRYLWLVSQMSNWKRQISFSLADGRRLDGNMFNV